MLIHMFTAVLLCAQPSGPGPPVGPTAENGDDRGRDTHTDGGHLRDGCRPWALLQDLVEGR